MSTDTPNESFSVAGMTIRECPCGHEYIIVSGAAGRRMMEFRTGELDIHHCEDGPQVCPTCGAALNIPPAEQLDMTRSPFGQWLMDHFDVQIDN